MKKIYQQRLKRILQCLKSEVAPACMLLSAAPQQLISRDSDAPYRQNSDFFYLTGSAIKDASLLVTGLQPEVFLIVRKQSPQEILWNGAAEDTKTLAKQLGATLILTDNIKRELLSRIKDHQILYYQNEPSYTANIILKELISLPSHERGSFPAIFKHLDLIVAPMRFIKDAEELRLIKQAIKISAKSLAATQEFISSARSEKELAIFLENKIREQGSELAFETILASGKSAAILHYTQLKRRLKNGELLLIDFGARHQGYCADISRTIPVNGKFSSWQKDLYQIVLEAQLASINKIKAGVQVKTIYDAAAKILTQGLIDLKIIKGPLKSALEKKLFSPYFPHGIGHSLGIDVHDVNIKPAVAGQRLGATIEAGMVITIEPGLYFQKATKNIPACGIRIEDDILVTKSGYENLSAGLIPKF